MDVKQKILVVDDQRVNRDLFSMILEKLGCGSVLACDGEEALEKAQNNDFSIVFMDIQMPKMDGYAASRNLRDRGFSQPIVAITASDYEEERENCLKAGMNDLLIKPVKRADIDGMLKKWIHFESSYVPVEPPVVALADCAFDVPGVLDTFMNNKAALLSLLSRFIERTKVQLVKLPELEKAADWESAFREVHMIKGAAFTMGGAELGKAATILEKAYKNAAKDDLEKAYFLLCKAFDSYKEEAEEFIRIETSS